jgi:hypothetical protein
MEDFIRKATKKIKHEGYDTYLVNSYSLKEDPWLDQVDLKALQSFETNKITYKK